MRRSNLLVPVLAVGLIAACLVTGAKLTSRSPSAPGVPATGSDAAATLSCKPRPPVRVELVQRDNGWQVAIEAHEATTGVQLRVGTGEVGRAGSTLWSGALQAGERRTFDAHMAVGAQDAWAVCEIASAAGTTLRSVALVPAPASRNLTAAAESGRIVVDPTTGDGVFEYRGQMEGSR